MVNISNNHIYDYLKQALGIQLIPLKKQVYIIQVKAISLIMSPRELL